MSAAIDWRRSVRLLAVLRMGSLWKELLTLLVLLAFLMLGNLLALGSGTRALVSNSGLLLVMLTYALFAWTGSANAFWRRLPVSRGTRQTAAWIVVSAVPLLANLVSCLLSAAVLDLAGHAVDLDHLLALIGFQGLLAQGMALVAVLIGDWPGDLGRFMVVSERKRSDWLMVSIMMMLVIGGGFFGSQIAAPRGLGLVASVSAFSLSAALLPLGRRFARLDPAHTEARPVRPAWYERLRLSGWSGHFVLETARSLAAGGALVIGLVVMSALPFPGAPPGEHGPGPLPMLEAFSSNGLGPAMFSLVAVLLGLQHLMRHRRLLLTLPRGDLLLMVTPAYNALLIFLPLAVVMAPREPGGWDLWLIHIATGALVALGLAYAFLAAMLRATTTLQVLVPGAVLGLPISVLLVVALIVNDRPDIAGYVNLAAATAGGLLLVGSLVMCLTQLRGSRNPYRPWPLGQVRWGGS